MRNTLSLLTGAPNSIFTRRAASIPLRLFANDEPGVWFEANDANTLFTDVAGTTPVTSPGDAVALQLDKSGRGNHRTQATTAARPLYALHPVGGVRNLLEYTEEFNNAVWNKPNVTVTANAAVAPDEEATADKLIVNTGVSGYVADDTVLVPGVQYTLSAYGKAGEWDYLYLYVSDGAVVPRAWFNLTTGTVGTQLGSPDDVAITDEGNGWYRCSVTFTATDTGAANGLRVYPTNADNASSLGDGTSGIFLWGAQFEEGSTATNYQRVGSFLDVSEEGKARRGRLWYNGTSHFMQTGTITPGTDKVQVFAGVRKLSDAAAGILIELSSGLFSGRFRLMPNQNSPILAEFLSRGTSNSIALGSPSSAPSSILLTGLGDISGDSAILRINGVQEAISTTDQGTGNYLAQPIYFGARAGTSLFYNGYEDTSIVRFGPNLDDTTISKVESYVASKTPASELLIPAGPELVTNGTFDTDVSGWTATRSASLALVSNTIEVTGTGTTQSAASQGITTTIGETYVVSFDLVSETGTARFAVSSQDNLNTSPDILNNLSLSAGQSYTFTFKANATTTYLHLASAGATDVTSWDNVSVRQLIPK